jgi:hypothetical protein
MPHGERPHVNTLHPWHHHFWTEPEAAMFIVCIIQVLLQTVSLSQKTHLRGGGVELFNLPCSSVLLAGLGMALYDVFECVPAVKTRPLALAAEDPLDHYAVMLFT